MTTPTPEMIEAAARAAMTFDTTGFDEAGDFTRRHYLELARRALVAALAVAPPTRGSRVDVQGVGA